MDFMEFSGAPAVLSTRAPAAKPLGRAAPAVELATRASASRRVVKVISLRESSTGVSGFAAVHDQLCTGHVGKVVRCEDQR
jgi:hypothetical protein